MHYYQHHIGDFIKDTSFLTNEEVGIYLKLLWLYYDTENPLPDSVFELSMKVNARDQQEALLGILNMFFKLVDGNWHHTRCDKEISFYHQQIDAASKAGKASAAKRAFNKLSTVDQQPFNERSTSVQPTNNQEPITNKHKPIKNTVAPPVGVTDSVWQDWLILRKAKRAAVTQSALNGMIRESGKAGISVQEAMEMCCMRGWTGFKAEWLKDAGQKSFAEKDYDFKRQRWEAMTGRTPQAEIKSYNFMEIEDDTTH